MPTAMLIADAGDARDAVGLYLAARGWITVPLVPHPDAIRRAVADLGPELVAIDFRGHPDDALACLRVLEGGAVPVYLFNAPEGLASAAAGVVRALGPADVPSAPGHPAHPHEH
jgi:hypothetical protein